MASELERRIGIMSSLATATVIRMLETLPENMQGQVVEHLRDYIEDLQDEMQWDESFEKTQQKLVAAARRANEEIAAGRAKPMDYGQL
jgi:alpha/beta superfamily hydrolase